MKIRLDVSQERRAALEQELTALGIIIDSEADLVLYESSPSSIIAAKNSSDGSRILLKPEEIILVEAFGHTVEIHTVHGIYHSAEPLYQVAARLGDEHFIRISNSVVVAKSRVRSITPTLSMKFILTLENGRKVDVTRSYYYIFKDAFGI